MNKNGMIRTMLAGVALFSLLTFLAACGGGGDDGGVAGKTGTITLATSASSMPADGSSSVVITATVKDSAGNPVRHYTDVNFSTNLGYFRNFGTSYTMQTQPPLDEKGWPDPKAAPTGIAEVSFMGGSAPGVAKVTVSSNNVSAAVYITISGSSAGITLTAAPESIPADGESSTIVTATLTDSSGSPVKPGTQVTFTTGLGHFLSDMKSYTVVTPDSTGIVKVAMQAGVVPGRTYIEATSNNITQALSIILTRTDPLYAEITIEANPSRIPADGVSQSVITATVTRTRNVADATAGQPISGVPITFYKITSNAVPEPLPEANLYTGSGTSIKGPFYSFGGLIEFNMTAIPQEESAPYFIVWLFNPLSGASERISLCDLDASKFDCEVWDDKWHCKTKTVKESKSPLPGNYQLEIQTNCKFEIKVNGDIGPAQTGKIVLNFGETDLNGKAVYAYTADWLPGKFKVKAETGELSNSENNALSDECFLTQTDGTPAPIEINIPSTPLYANGENSMTVTAVVWTAEGNQAPDGTVVYFSASSGSITPSSVTVDGIASATLTAAASSTSIICTVTATAGTESASGTVTFVGVSLMDMQATPATIFANGTDVSKISVRIRDANGLAVVDESVTFAATSGSIQSQTATTDSEGIAQTNLIAPIQPGMATVTAMYGLITATTTVTFTSSVPVGTITLTADPTTLPADGKSSSTITAEIKDTSNTPVPKGTSVTFTTTLGTFSNGTNTITAYTGSDADGKPTGRVSVSLISATTPGSALVTASCAGVSQSIYVGFGGSTISIALVANPTTIPADGTSSSTITATLTDGSGKPVTAATSITFTTSLGKFSNGAATITTTTIGDTGVASVSLIAAATPGSARVTATSLGVSQSIYVGFGGSPISIALVANPTTIPADGTSSSTITATLTDGNGDPVTAGTSVTFTTSLGKFSNGGATITSSTIGDTGKASVSLIAATTGGVATVTATSSGVSQSVRVTFTGGAGSILLTADPGSIPADGTSSSTITAELKNASGTPVTAGTSLTFTTDLGKFSNGSTAFTTTTQDATGKVTVSLIAATTPGTAKVTCTSGGVSQSIKVGFRGGEVAKIELTANPTSLSADGASTSIITATVKTADNQLIPGAEVVFTTTRGSITPSQITDDLGQAKATLTSERYNDPSVAVKATSEGIQATVFVSFAGLTLTVEASTESVLTGEAADITATLKDGAGNPISDTTVTFSTDKGTLEPATPQLTNPLGKAFVKLTSTISGTATVTAVARGATGKVSVKFTTYLFRFLTPDPATIRVGGETSQLTAQILDNGVPRFGQLVFFSSTLGTLNPYDEVTGADGKAKTVITSGSQAGIAVVDANVTVDGAQLAATTQVVITGGDAVKIVLSADPQTIHTTSGVSTVTAHVYDANDQPAANQNLYFGINTGPGGGERLSASVKTTDTYGVATVYFYAGTLPSTLNGVEIEANTRPDFGGSFGLVNLTIAGPVANIGIGMDLETLEPEGGCLKIDICGVATDINGNPAPNGTKINFSVKAIEFDEDRDNDLTIDCWDDNRNPIIPCPAVGTSGFGLTWFSDDVNQDGTMYSMGGPMSTTEDVNHNGKLDPGEDKNDNGVIDPIQGCTIDSSLETTDGTAAATLTYPMPQANNIKVRITAESGGVSNFYETILLCTQTMVDQGTCGIAY